MAALPVPEHEFYAFLLIGARTGGLLTGTPILGNHSVPRQALAGLAIVFAMAITPVLTPHTGPIPSSLIALGLLVLQNGIIGLAIGYFTMLLFSAVKIAGFFIDTQMGFGIVNLLDPFSQQQSSVMAAFQYQTAMTLYFILNGPLLLLGALTRSFTAIPPDAVVSGIAHVNNLIPMLSTMMQLSFQLALPAFGVLLLTDVGLGLIARAAPQINVFIVGMPAKIIMGLATVAFLMPVLGIVVGRIIIGTNSGFAALLASLR
jgi:flagellar biosynthetic protein FliR